MKVRIGNTITLPFETDQAKLKEVELYNFSRRPVKALLDGHGQPVKVHDAGQPIFYIIPAGMYEALTEFIESHSDEEFTPSKKETVELLKRLVSK